MIKKRSVLLLTVIPFILGFLVAGSLVKKPNKTAQIAFHNNAVSSTDRITLAYNGDIFDLTKNAVKQITHNRKLIEPSPLGQNYIAIDKETNYSSLLEFNLNGDLIKTLFNGNTKKLDTMSWITDPSVSPNQDRIAYVSDKDKQQTLVPDNALYVLNLSTEKSTHIAKPYPYSGGIAHPVFKPTDPNILLYDYYQYDSKTLQPYSTIMEYNKRTGEIFPLTADTQNAYQSAFSKDGKRVLFLIRDDNMITVTLYIADITDTGLSNERALASGDFAYPQFSYTSDRIYYLQANGNTNYDLYEAVVSNGNLTGKTPITNGSNLMGNSSFTISRNQ